MILDFTDKNNVRRIIDVNQVIAVTHNPDFDGKSRILFYLLGGGDIRFTPPEDMDVDLVLASIVNHMKKRNQ